MASWNWSPDETGMDDEEGPTVVTGEGWVCQRCGASFAEYINCYELDCGPLRKEEE